MNSFTLGSACHGVRPRSAQATEIHGRSHLVSRLALGRQSLRCIVAPTGYGKTFLAAEYASTMFAFKKVYWINTQSPCFLRDLDQGAMYSDLLLSGRDVNLVVFEDLPSLDESRQEVFGNLVSALIGAEIEVVITMVPSNDYLSVLPHDRFAITAQDLLLMSEEVAESGHDLPDGLILSAQLEKRIPAFAWGSEGQQVFLEGCAQEELPLDMAMVHWGMLAMQKGDLQDVRRLAGEAHAQEFWDYAHDAYPHLGIERSEGTFNAVSVSTDFLKLAYGHKVEDFVKVSKAKTYDTLVSLIVETCLAHGNRVRAGQMLATMAPRSVVGKRLSRLGWNLVWEGAAEELEVLYGLASRSRIKDRPAVNAMMAWAAAIDGDLGRCLSFARTSLSAARSTEETRVLALVAQMLYGNHDVASEAAVDAQQYCKPRKTRRRWDLLLKVSYARTANQGTLAAWFALGGSRSNAAVPPDARFIEREMEAFTASLIVDDMAAGLEIMAAAQARTLGYSHVRDALLEFSDECCLLMEESMTAQTFGWGMAQLTSSLERVSLNRRRELDMAVATSKKLVGYTTRLFGLIGETGIRTIRAADQTFARSRRSLHRSSRPKLERLRFENSVLMSDAVLAAPILRVRLFGGLDVRVGNLNAAPVNMGRKKVRVLFALLVLYRGRELKKETIMSMMWPNAAPKNAIKSFYALWRDLRRIFMMDGSCPYLISSQYGCRLNETLFTSDVSDFEDILRKLVYESKDPDFDWEDTLRTITENFSLDLMPGETSNEEIIQFRERFSLEMVDALVSAARQLLNGGEPQGALWLAREALRRDDIREDAYEIAMEAQMSLGHRAGAIDTYLSYQRFLNEKLGLDPSGRIAALYQSLLECA